MKYRADTFFYHLGKVVWLPVILIGSWFSHTGFQQYGSLFSCTFQRLFHVPCPGCGGTRAVCALFAGRLYESFLYHPAVLYGCMAYLHFMALYFYRKHISGTDREIKMEYYMYVAIAVILVQWLIKLMIQLKIS